MDKAKKKEPKGIYRHGDQYWMDFLYKGTRVREKICAVNALGSLEFAKKALAKRKTEVAEGHFLDVKKEVTTTFGELAEKYVHDFGVKMKSWNSGGVIYLKHLKAHFKDMQINKIYTTTVRAYQQERKKVTGPHEVNRELSLMRRIFNLAASGYWRNPNNEDESLFTGMNPVKIVKGGALQFDKEEPRSVYLTKGKLIKLLGACDEGLRDYILFAVVTGLRFGEQFGLNRENINTAEGWLFLPMTKNGKSRYVPLCKIARSILNSGADFSFDPRKRSWKSAMKAAGILDLHWHDLRHTTATYLEENDVPGEKIKAIMGHTEKSVTDIYKNLHPIKKVQKLIPHVGTLDTYLADVYWRPLACGDSVGNSIQNDDTRYASINTLQREA